MLNKNHLIVVKKSIIKSIKKNFINNQGLGLDHTIKNIRKKTIIKKIIKNQGPDQSQKTITNKKFNNIQIKIKFKMKK